MNKNSIRVYNTAYRKKINDKIHKINNEKVLYSIYEIIVNDIGYNYSKNINGIFINLNIVSDKCIELLTNLIDSFYSNNSIIEVDLITSTYKYNYLELMTEMGHKLSNKEKRFILRNNKT